DVYDPQKILRGQDDERFFFTRHTYKGTFFVKLRQGEMTWWQAINVDLVQPVQTDFVQRNKHHYLSLKNRTTQNQVVDIDGMGVKKEVKLSSSESVEITLPTTGLSMGTNKLRVRTGQDQWTARYIVWDIENQGMYQPQDLSSYYNARVRDIFEQRYLSPRPDVPTLQLPWQGIGNWCYPLIEASIDDNGLMAVRKEQSVTYLGVPFLIKGDAKNVVFTSQWDNYPTTVEVPLQGKAEKAYLLMAGSTNPMQAEMINARVKVTYTDGEVDILDLKNPTNWWPIEQDYLD